MDGMMNALVPQSETDKYIAGIFLDQKLAEAYKIYKTMEQIKSDIRKKKVAARREFDQRISPLQVRLNQARIESGLYSGQGRVPPKSNCRCNDTKVHIKSCKHFYHMIVKKLHLQGDFISNELMDRASKAFKTGEFNVLFDVWEKTKEITANGPESTGTRIDGDELLLNKIRRLHFLQLSIDVIEHQIIQLEADIIYRSYIDGRDAFKLLLDDTEEAIKAEIKILEQGVEHD